MSAVDRAAAVREVAAWSAPILAGTGIAPGAPVDPDAHPAGSAAQAWACGWRDAATGNRIETRGERP